MSLPSAPLYPPQPVASPQGGPPPSRIAVAADTALRVVGGFLAVAAAALTAVLELIFSTLRAGGQLVGVSVVIAVVANVAIGWFAYRTVGRRWAVALPALAWFTLMGVASGRTDEGDLLLAGDNWVGLAMIFAGSMAFAGVAVKLIISPHG